MADDAKASPMKKPRKSANPKPLKLANPYRYLVSEEIHEPLMNPNSMRLLAQLMTTTKQEQKVSFNSDIQQAKVTVITRNPDKLLDMLVAEPNPACPIFQTLCKKHEDAGIPIANNPANTHPEYLELTRPSVDSNEAKLNSPAQQQPANLTNLNASASMPTLLMKSNQSETMVKCSESKQKESVKMPMLRHFALDKKFKARTPRTISKKSIGNKNNYDQLSHKTFEKKKPFLIQTMNGMHLSEEEATQVRKMIIESTKLRPDINKLKDLMQKTYPTRRKWMEFLSSDLSVAKIIRAFPALRFDKIITTEFGLISGCKFREFRSELQIELENLLNAPSTIAAIADKYPVCQKAYDSLRFSKFSPGSSKYEDLRNSIAMLFLWHKLVPKIEDESFYKYWIPADDSEDDTTIRRKKKGFPRTPYILITKGRLVNPNCDGQMVIYAENHEITRCANFYQSVIMIYAVYTIFFFQYDTSVKELLEFFDGLVNER